VHKLFLYLHLFYLTFGNHNPGIFANRDRTSTRQKIGIKSSLERYGICRNMVNDALVGNGAFAHPNLPGWQKIIYVPGANGGFAGQQIKLKLGHNNFLVIGKEVPKHNTKKLNRIVPALRCRA
jgi:hypothetical protein